MAKILVVRLDGIGDALICTPLLAALRDAGHTVGIALSDRNADIFAPDALAARHILERIPWPKHGSTVASTERARAEIVAAAYDIALIVSEEPEAYALARGIGTRVGFWTGWAKPLKSLWVRTQVTTSVHRNASVGGEPVHEAQIVFRLGAGLHDEAEPTRDPARLRSLILREERPARREHIVVQLGEKWLKLGLDPASVGAIIAHLAAQGAQLVVSSAERAIAAPLAGGAPYIVFDNLHGWKRAIDGARLVVTPDTGAAHLAGMLGIPTIDCFPDEHATQQIARWHPWAAHYWAISACELRGGEGVARIERALHAL